MKKKSKGLTKVQIYFWGSEGNNPPPSSCDFGLEVVINGYLDFTVGKPAIIRKKLKYLQYRYGIKFPKVSWKTIVGDDENGGNCCYLVNK